MSEPQFNQYAFGLACTVGWTELVQAMRKDGHTVNDKSGPNTRAWMENIVRDTFIAQATGHLTPRRAEAVVLLQKLGYHWDGETWNAPIPHPTLRDQLQQQCSDWKVYWRAPDAHGVELTPEQAYELLRRALGVEVNIAGVKDSSLPPDMVLVDAGGSAPPIAVSIDRGGNDDLSIAYLLGKYDGRKAALQQGGQEMVDAPIDATDNADYIRHCADKAAGEFSECPHCKGWSRTPPPAIDIGKLRELAGQLKSMANTAREYAKRPSVSAQDVKDMLGLVRIFERSYRELCVAIGDT